MVAPIRVDALVLTALQDELSAFLRALGNSHEARDAHGYRFHLGDLAAEGGGTLSVAAAWIGEMGPAAAAARAATLVNELNPNCLAMCGICAGKRGEAALGDVIVASQVYEYDRGKLVARDRGETITDFYRDITTYNLEKRWAMDAAYLAKDVDWIASFAPLRPMSMRSQLRWLLATLYAFEQHAHPAPKDHAERKKRCPDWARVVAKARAEELVLLAKGQLVLTEKGRDLAAEDELLFPDGLPEDPAMRVLVGPIATGSAVQEDPLLFDRLSRHVRKTLGVEMEASAIGYVAELLSRRSIVVKAVSDHADHDKDDHFRDFACTASASWLLSFLRRHLEPTVIAPENGPSALAGLRANDVQLANVAEKLEEAIGRRNKLRGANVDTAVLDREIVALRRQMREGGILRVGDSLGDGRYLLVEEVGQGGFARVWRARDRESNTDVAIKVLRSDLAHDPVRKERFFRGARMMVELGHPHVVRVLEQRGEDGGFYWFVMEYVPGGDFRAQVLSGRLVPDVALGMLLVVGDALAVAHARGLVHRDVKPANILLHADGQPRLTDFDLVAAADTTGGTRSGAMGTFLYAAPECLHRPQDATPRADVYGLGMTAVFALYGQELPLEVVRDARGFIERLECSLPVKEVLYQATAWKAEERHADARAFAEALRDARSPSRVVAPVVAKETVPGAQVPNDVDTSGLSAELHREPIGRPRIVIPNAAKNSPRKGVALSAQAPKAQTSSATRQTTTTDDAVTCLSFVAGGRRLVSGHQSGRIAYFRTTVGHHKKVTTTPLQQPILTLSALNDEPILLACTTTGDFMMWAPEDDRLRRWGMLPQFREDSAVTLHPSGLVAALVGAKIQVYRFTDDSVGLTRLTAIEPGGHKVTSLGFSFHAKSIYAGFPFQTIRAYSVETGVLEGMNPGTEGKVTKIIAHRDEQLVAAISSTGKLKLNAATGKLSWPTLWTTRSGEVKAAAFAHLDQNTPVVCALLRQRADEMAFCIFDAKQGSPLMNVLIPKATCLAASPTEAQVAVGLSDGAVVLVDLHKKAVVQTY